MFKKSIPIMIALTMIISLASCGGGGGDKKDTIRINFSHTQAPNSVSDLAAKHFKELVEEKSDGEIVVNIASNSGLSGGDLTKAIEMTMLGDIDIHSAAPTNVANYDPRFYVFWMPYIFPTPESLEAVANSEEIFTEINKWAGEKNLIMLGFHNAGARQLSSNKKPIRTPEDLKAMNIRVPGAQLFIDLYRDYFQANPTAMDFSEVYTALQQNTIDGQENPVSVFDSSKFSEVQEYITLWDYVRDTTGWFMSQKTMDKLTEEQQQIILECANESLEWAGNYVLENEVKIIEKIKGEGVTVVELTEAEKQAFIDISAPIYEEYEEIIGKEVLDLFQSVAKNS